MALDNGCVEQISLKFSDESIGPKVTTPFFYLERQHCVQEHDDIISGMDVTADEKMLVTSSYDKCIVCLDLETLRLESRINEAHHDLITDLAANKVAAHTIATAAQDGTVKSWDLRSNSRQTCKLSSSFCHLHKVAN